MQWEHAGIDDGLHAALVGRLSMQRRQSDQVRLLNKLEDQSNPLHIAVTPNPISSHFILDLRKDPREVALLIVRLIIRILFA
jgi:hypothetical protein